MKKKKIRVKKIKREEEKGIEGKEKKDVSFKGLHFDGLEKHTYTPNFTHAHDTWIQNNFKFCSWCLQLDVEVFMHPKFNQKLVYHANLNSIA